MQPREKSTTWTLRRTKEQTQSAEPSAKYTNIFHQRTVAGHQKQQRLVTYHSAPKKNLPPSAMQKFACIIMQLTAACQVGIRSALYAHERDLWPFLSSTQRTSSHHCSGTSVGPQAPPNTKCCSSTTGRALAACPRHVVSICRAALPILALQLNNYCPSCTRKRRRHRPNKPPPAQRGMHQELKKINTPCRTTPGTGSGLGANANPINLARFRVRSLILLCTMKRATLNIKPFYFNLLLQI